METIIIHSDPLEIAHVEAFIEANKEKFAISDDAFGNILISVTEAANNAIIHGNQCDPQKSVEISCFLNPEKKRIIYTVKDKGAGFDHTQLSDPTLDENLDKPSGRGVFLMKQLSDLLVFSDNGATAEMQFSI